MIHLHKTGLAKNYRVEEGRTAYMGGNTALGAVGKLVVDWGLRIRSGEEHPCTMGAEVEQLLGEGWRGRMVKGHSLRPKLEGEGTGNGVCEDAI